MNALKYLAGYSATVLDQVHKLIDNDKLAEVLLKNTLSPMISEPIKHSMPIELAHSREKQHNKTFYKLCEYMEPDYHQLEFDMRLYLTYLDLAEKIY
jgi:hypothetical protein